MPKLTDGSRDRSLMTMATRGVAWSLSSSVAVMSISLAAQIILGWLLTDHDFGVYAYAIAFYHIFRVCTDGGVGLWLARLRQDEYDRECGHAFWLASSLSVVLAALVAIIAIPVSKLYAEPEVAKLLWVLAAALPFNAIRVVLLPGLQVHLKFQSLAVIKFVSAVVRYSMVVGLAVAGFGPLSFVIPVLVITLLEDVAYFASLRIPVWRTRFSWRNIKRILSESCWSLAGTVPEAIGSQIDYAVLGLVVSTEVVGVYFFAYQLTIQMVMLFSESLRRVILPVFARVERGSEGERRGLRLSSSFLGIVAAPAMLLLVALAEPIETLLWRGRWESAVLPMMLLAAVMPLNLMSIFAEMLVQSRGRFRLWATAVLVRGLLFGVVAYAVGLLTGGTDVGEVTFWLAAYVAAAAVFETIVLLHGIGLNAASFFARFVPPFVVAALLVVGVLALADGGPPSLWTILVRTSSFVIVMALLVKTLFEQSLNDVIATMMRMRPRST